ncbi:DUF2239 family protein, partial [Brevundimonas sp.]|uniref:DUF2239 family protein n=1 Tax=Brevundimonas sp. TaxID=1871086 RepID=UPI002ED803BE
MSVPSDLPVVAFVGADRIVAPTPLHRVLPALHAAAAAGKGPLVVSLVDGRGVDRDRRGEGREALARLAPARAPAETRGPGRPKLG